MAATRDDDLPTLDVTSRGTEFVDNEGRTLTLRGVNLGGAKLPAGYRSDHRRNLSYTLWLYEPTHASQPWYDGWNLEDLSIYSRAPQARYGSLERDPSNVHFGARGLRAFARPFCRRRAAVWKSTGVSRELAWMALGVDATI